MIGHVLNDNIDKKPHSREMEKLKKEFPQFFTKEGAFKEDSFFEFLKHDEIDLSKEGYELKFLGKSYAKYLSSLETETFIAPDRDHNNEEENKNSDNLYIVGDNLDALKHLLGSYGGKIKCIYIDPPYNTGTDGFVYPDNFQFNGEELASTIGIAEEEAERIIQMAGKSTHSAWLTFMYPRLVLARDLLAEDGVIFISIDDNEQANLKLMCDEIFGEENFVAKFDWRKKTGANDAKDIAVVTEPIIMYSRSKVKAIETNLFNRDLSSIKSSRYNKKDKYFKERGHFYYDTLDRGGLQYSDSMNYGILTPDEKVLYPNNRNSFENDGWIWKWSKDKVNWGIENGFIDFIKVNGEYTLKYKVYEFVDNEGNLRENRGRAFSNFIYEPINQIGTNEIKSLFNEQVIFNNPKPKNLVKYLIRTVKTKDQYILDFFSGSGTTADAVMQLNAEDGGNRKYIMVQLPEIIDEKKPAYKAGYRTIDEIGRARIQKAAEKIRKDTGASIDYGFKLFYLQEPEEKTLDRLEEFSPTVQLMAGDMVSIFDNEHGIGKESILATWLNEDGYGLSAVSQVYVLDRYKANLIEKSLYIIESGLTSEDVMELVKRIEDDSLAIQRVVVYLHSLDFNVLQELRKNLAVLRNNKNVSLIERF